MEGTTKLATMEVNAKDHATKEETKVPSKDGWNPNSNEDAGRNLSSDYTIIFVLGGPGSGKGTQCSKIAKNFRFCHLSAGDLLDKEVESGSDNGSMIKAFKMEGKLVPTEIIIKLLQRAMEESENKKFLIDGFPRNEENRIAFENIMKTEPEFVLFFECSDEMMTRRLLNRNQGRADDNIATIQKRFKVFFEFTVPVVSYYNSKGKVRKIDAERPVEEVFEEVKTVFSKFKLGK